MAQGMTVLSLSNPRGNKPPFQNSHPRAQGKQEKGRKEQQKYDKRKEMFY